MEPGIFFRGVWVCRHILTGEVEFTTRPVAILEVVVARLASHRCGFAHFLEIPLAGFVACVLAPFDLLPFPWLAVMAMRASKCPLAHVGGFKLAVGVVVFLSALAHEEALAKPAKCGDAGFGLSHVPLRVAPCFIADKPTDRAALEVGLVVCPQHPERHAVVEVDGGKPPFVAVGRIEGFHRLAFVKELLEPAFTLVLGIVIGLIEP